MFETIYGMEYLTRKGMQAGAIEAIECAKVVRQWLPIKAAKKTLSSSQMMDRWYTDMANRCIAFFGYHPRLGEYATIGPKPSHNLWRELCLAMSELRDHYDLQDVDGDNKIPHSNVRGGQKLKPIDAGILDRIEQAANGLLDIKEGKQLFGYVDAVKNQTEDVETTGPFEFEYDRAIKLLGVGAKRELLANKIYYKCSPKQKKHLCSDYKCKDGAIAKLVKDIDNLRAKRKKQVDSR